jgi:hypothetical protein
LGEMGCGKLRIPWDKTLTMRSVGNLYWKLVEKFDKHAYLNHLLDSGDPNSDPDGYAELTREAFVIETKKWTKRGMKVNVSVWDVAPRKEGEQGPWRDGETGSYIEFDTLQKFKRLVEDREYEREKRKREGREAWIKWWTAFFAFFGGVGAIVALGKSLLKFVLTYLGKKP